MNNAATANNLEHNDKARLMKLATGASVLVATARVVCSEISRT